MQGYTFQTETEAIAARKQAADYMGLPVPNGETLYWVDYIYYERNNFYYITYVDGLEAVLGEPTEFEVIQPNPFNETTNNL
jgi:hypothetical protein